MADPSPEMLWIRCETPEQVKIAQSLQSRLMADDVPVDVAIETGGDERDLIRSAKAKGPLAALWLGGAITPALLAACEKENLPLGIAGQSPDDLRALTKRGLFRRKQNLKPLCFASLQSKESAAILARLDLPSTCLIMSPPPKPDFPVLTCSETERQALASHLGTRQTVFAAGATPDEADLLAKAFQTARRAAHRFLMIICAEGSADEMADAMTAQGLTVALQSETKAPGEEVQIFVADTMERAGLMYRIATMSFICGTFGTGARVDPFEAATLGSAIIAGPNHGSYGEHFALLGAQQALLPLISADGLGTAMTTLLSVEKAARFAHAGWQVSTQGVEGLDQLDALVRRELLRLEA